MKRRMRKKKRKVVLDDFDGYGRFVKESGFDIRGCV
jgi:hypothetical protein